MSLPWREALTARLMPAGVYYASRLSDEQAWGEHELGLLGEIVRPGGTAVDVGANQGVFSYAFSRIADRVEAFEPNPDYADFSRRMLGTRARVHQVALSNQCGMGDLIVPISEEGTVLHLGGALKPAGAEGPGCKAQRFQVKVRTLDSYGFRDVHAIKVDVEGSEMQVLEGARATIACNRPALIVELLTGAHADPLALTEQISAGYEAWLATPDRKTVAAGPVLRCLGSNTTWGSPIRNRNVLFLPG